VFNINSVLHSGQIKPSISSAAILIVNGLFNFNSF
jgi:hypothetical protein